MLTLNLAPVLQARGIEKPYSFLVKAGISHTTASNILNRSTRSFKLDHIETICRLLNCEPNDILSFKPQKDINYPPNHPLFNLSRTDAGPSLQDTLSALPFKQLKEITETILKKNDGNT